MKQEGKFRVFEYKGGGVSDKDATLTPISKPASKEAAQRHADRLNSQQDFSEGETILSYIVKPV